ncbi:AAA family ATPase [Francisella philomiragia]|uniref:AAA family ATPase n=1 Tax=Francisella philomiragia TaxID=28110 RepID=UPI00190429E0|nr:ATP-binding protein [Francisella philomiragia]MBK2256668.1 ATP-binding protein [Francisella philomiragia]MBK2269326.1 ATP-binding protein [Francisella philomiragia]MBK2271309.1 ATP-binding protein [Francisella philomiragia]MBK2275089.1 ATP-binding protein [Francisella philomiragia]MBK2294683.1 ATP-binding protein [Francisella philomiragia]
MLIEFSVSNFRSIKEETSFSMISSKSENKNAFEKSIANKNTSLYKSSCIYGLNAGGKSNLLKAIATMKEIVLTSDKLPDDSSQEKYNDFQPYLFDNHSKDEPSLFEVVFAIGETKYQYGFKILNNKIIEEWLYVYESHRPQKWFVRENDKYNYSAQFKGEKKTWENSTREDSLFLTTAIKLNSEQLKPIFNWFRMLLIINRKNLSDRVLNTFVYNNESNNNKNKILEFIQKADFAITDFSFKERAYSSDDLKKLPKELQNMLEGKKTIDVKTTHTNQHGTFSLDFERESDGTRRIFNDAGLFLKVLENDKMPAPIFIDELDIHLHPNLVKQIVEIFNSDKLNKYNNQLIFTTHNTSLLAKGIFEREQIWFIDRNKDQESELYSLADFGERKSDSNSFEKRYLEGRYGAVPILDDLKELI